MMILNENMSEDPFYRVYFNGYKAHLGRVHISSCIFDQVFKFHRGTKLSIACFVEQMCNIMFFFTLKATY